MPPPELVPPPVVPPLVVALPPVSVLDFRQSAIADSVKKARNSAHILRNRVPFRTSASSGCSRLERTDSLRGSIRKTRSATGYSAAQPRPRSCSRRQSAAGNCCFLEWAPHSPAPCGRGKGEGSRAGRRERLLQLGRRIDSLARCCALTPPPTPAHKGRGNAD